MNAETRVDELLSLWQERRARGQDMTPAELCADCPELLPEVERRLAALRDAQGMIDTDNAPASTAHWQADSAAPPPQRTTSESSSNVGGTVAQATPSAAALATFVRTVHVPGYEVLGELGRGGMGVVYRARQIALNRLVALKMILSGAHAGAEDLERFRAEAEAVARLQHPNIVQVHEVGEHEGRPFFALEFCPGGSLDKKLAGTPLPPEEAARMVELLARAVHAAHQHKVVHRDLKPANVLLAADGTPKIADFGLAKRLDEAGRTQSGAVMGTPSYMAPEQAGGRTKEVGPPADVYALGVMLYEMLTGRPPFKAATVMETLQQVMKDEPAPPRRLRSKVPVDLDSVCLKCLEKETRRRYASALELAEDLRRFQAGEPVRARSVGDWERALKWMRRHPWKAAAAGLLLAFVAALLAGGAFSAYFAVEANNALGREKERNGELAKEKNQFNGLLVSSVDAVGDYGELVDETVAPLPGSEQARRLLLEKRLEFYAPFLELGEDSSELQQRPELQSRKARALYEVGNIHRKLGAMPEAEKEYHDAIDLYESAIDRSTDARELRHELGDACVGLGNLLSELNRGDEAGRQYDRAIGLFQTLADEGDDDATLQRDLAAAYHDRADLRMGERRRAEALDDFGKAVALCKGLAAKDDKDDGLKVLLAENYADRGGLYRLQDDLKRGKADVEAALDLLGKVGPDFAGREDYRDALAAAHYHRGLLTAKSDWAGASKDFDAAARGWDGLHQDFPAVPRYQAQAAAAFLYLGRMRYADDRLPEAEVALRRADDLYGGLAGKWEKEPDYREGRDSSRDYLALVLRKESKFDEAAKLYEGLTAGAPRNAEYQMEFGEVTLAWASQTKLAGYALASLPPVGLTVAPNPLGMGQAYVGQQLSAKAEAATARDRYRQSLESLRLAEEYGQTTLSPDQHQTLAQRRFAAAQGLFGAALWVGDSESMAAAGETLAELAEAWPSLNAPNDAARNYRLAAMYSGLAVGAAGSENAAMGHAKRMLQLLHKAVDKGYRNAAELRASMDVRGLLNNPHAYLSEQREDLRKLLADLEHGPSRLR